MMTEQVCCDFGCSKVGVDYISNDIKTLQYPELSSKERKHQLYQAKQPRQTIYNLGNGLILTDPDKATEELMNREFQPIHDVCETPHEAIFSPDPFIFDKGIASKTVVKTSGRQNFSKESLDRLKQYDRTLEGSQEEEKVYNDLKKLFNTHTEKNIVVINGWKDVGGKNRKMREYDFLIISEPLKTIIHIEVKTAMTKGSIEKAADQLKSGKEFFESTIPLPALGKWKYVRVMSFAEKSGFSPCGKCQQYMIGPDTDLSQWWSQMKESQSDQSTQRDTTTYLNIMKYLLHQQFRQEDPITESALLDHTVKTTDEMSIFFWSKIQYSIINDVQNKRVALIATFGTGKTTLLKAKAKELLTLNQKVLFIIFSESSQSLLMLDIEKEFGNIQNLKIIRLPFQGNDLIETFGRDPNTNVFMDEVLVGREGITTQTLKEFAKLLSSNSYFWIACQSQFPPDKSFLQPDFNVPPLKLPLRYPSNLLQTCEAHRNNIKGVKWPPKDFKADNLLNKGNRTLFLALTPTTSFDAAVAQLAYILDKEVCRTIIKIESDDVQIIQKLKKSIVQDRIILEEKAGEFLNSENRILVVTSKGDSALKGFEVPLLVVFSRFLDGSLNENIFSRCKSKLIVVCDEEHATRIVPENGATDFAKSIQVYDKRMPAKLEKAIKENDSEEVHNYFIGNRPVPVNITNEQSQTGLMIACSFGAEKTFAILFTNEDDPPNLEAVDSQGWTALHYASSRGSTECLESLIKNGASVTATTNDGETAVHLASEKGHLETVKSLITQNCPINNMTRRRHNITKTALHLATSNKQVDIVECLLQNKANVNIKDQYDYTALHMAAKVGSVEITKMLLHYGANIGEKGENERTPLHLAAENGNLDVVKYLCEKGSDIEAKTRGGMLNLYFISSTGKGMTPLHFAAANGKLDVVKYLCEKGSDMEAKDDDEKTPLHLAAENGNLDVVKYLCEKGSDIEAKTCDEMTPLHFAAKNGNLDVVKYLCEKGSDIEAKGYGGKTPLHFAAENGNLDVVKYLCEKGSDIEAKTRGRLINEITTLMFAVKGSMFSRNQNKLQIVKYLVEEEKANLSAKDNEGMTVLMHAVSGYAKDSAQVVKYLVEEQKANLMDKDNEGKTVLMHAAMVVRWLQLEIVKYLVEEHKVNLTEKDKEGKTVLMHAAMNWCKLEVVKYLVEEQKVNLTEKDKEGKTCLDHAKRDDVIKYLKTKGIATEASEGDDDDTTDDETDDDDTTDDD